jgi:phospholipid/cholesterol/gamma-HCH transport system substrate-binding protein
MADPTESIPPPVSNLEVKARLLVLVMILLVAGAVAYLMYARGAFERTQELVLIADDAEGVAAGMDMTFSGFPIGRIGRIELSGDGNARIIVNVPRKDAHWLRTSSVFTMENGLVGGPRFRAFSGVLTDPPLPDGAERKVLRGDAAAEIPKMIASVRDLVSNISALTASDAPLGATLQSLQKAAGRLNGPGGALGVVLGSEAEAKKLTLALDRTNTLLARLDGLVVKADSIAIKTDGMVSRADTQVFGPGGVMTETRATVVQLNGLLADARASLKKVDAVLVEAQAIGANTREATNDLGALRGEVDASLRKVEQLVNEINRKWPFKRDSEIKLP